MSHLHVVIGPVGAGKSTYVQSLCAQEKALPMVLDGWMATLFGADERPNEGRVEWYVERTERCLNQIWEVAEASVALGMSVVVEPGLIRRQDRMAFYERIDAAEISHTVHVVDAPRAVRWERVQRRNREQGATFSVAVPKAFFDLSSDLWDEVDAEEQRHRTVFFAGQAREPT